MTLSKIYELYSNEAKSTDIKLLSAAKVNKLFYTKFNLRTKPLKKDTCNKCDFFESQILVLSEENRGIHTGSKDEAHCNVWVEGEAGRGAQEVGSCLIKHITERLDDNVKFLILWSDSCGGQNRNIKLILMLKAMLNEHPSLDQINIKFLESGHSFLPNDTDFGKIECALKRQQRLYTPDDYIHVMKTCKKTNPMHVHRMKNEDFLSSLKLEKNIINRKKTVDGEKVSWLHTKEIMIKKDEMFKIYMKTDLNEEFKVVDIKKNVRGRQYFITKALMAPLWPTGKPVPDAKLKDLKVCYTLFRKTHMIFM
ncbi:hypothetical protein HF086_015272 [Spodoptera exigua]|uniref:DUF7869 domain-containing protein n=1 Tax=Spodoptera exigua TaxID=7107 RepID=A0A922M8U5_SPOEX|nr:hypothetical protein HF086_015272 [Spodoptera exigua]